MQWSFTLENINDVAYRFWEHFPGNNVFAFKGAMGAGKTTFIHALCDAKGIKDRVSSPTFSIINEYTLESNEASKDKPVIYHLDLYRIKDEKEAAGAGVEDILNSGYTCLVEWPEKAPSLFPPGTVYASIEVVDSLTRRLIIGDN
jgi:tRNA threonylcarbamoyladenosine biosynthesis protein TsaE